MATIEVDEQTYRSIAFAAKMAGSTAGQVVSRLVSESALPAAAGTEETASDGVAIYADYEGRRTAAKFDPRTHRIDITSGPLTGRSYKTPSGAAIAVVRHHKPTVNPNRNGWGFWTLDDGSGRLLQTLR